MVLPERAAVVEPLLGGRERLRLDAAHAYATDLLGRHDATRLEHLDVLDHRRERHVERRRQIADGGGGSDETLDHLPTRRVGQRVEETVERMVKHVLYYSHDANISQAIA